MAILTYQQLIEHLQSGQNQLNRYQQFKNGFDIIEFYLEKLEGEFHRSQYIDTLSALLKWLDWFIGEIECEEGVLIHNVEYLNKRIRNYPAIELEIEASRIELQQRLGTQRNQNHQND